MPAVLTAWDYLGYCTAVHTYRFKQNLSNVCRSNNNILDSTNLNGEIVSASFEFRGAFVSSYRCRFQGIKDRNMHFYVCCKFIKFYFMV